MTPPPNSDQSGISESLRKAVEATFSATAGSAQDTRERASELLDDAVRRGRGARDEVVRRGQEAREEVVRRGRDAREEVAKRGEVLGTRVESELRSISERLAKLEAALRDRG